MEGERVIRILRGPVSAGISLLALILFCPVYATGERGHPFLSLLKEGDIIFQETLSEQGKAIKLATHSRYTHVGIIFKYGGVFRVLEAVQPVKITALDAFIKRGVNGHFVVKRLRERDALMTAEAVGKMKRLGRTFLGRDYDVYFEWSDNRIYCSELVWKLYKSGPGIEVGRLQKLKDFDLRDPYVNNIMRKRYGERIPRDEPVISPGSIFDADTLVVVTRTR